MVKIYPSPPIQGDKPCGSVELKGSVYVNIRDG